MPVTGTTDSDFMALVNAVGRLLAGRLGGWLGVVLFAGLPLLGHNATGGGFELLNLVMILGTMLLGARYLARRDGPAFTAFCFSALLLTPPGQTTGDGPPPANAFGYIGRAYGFGFIAAVDAFGFTARL